MPAPSPDDTTAYIAVGGTLAGVALAGLLTLLRSFGQRSHERTLADRSDLRDALARYLDASAAHHRAAANTAKATKVGNQPVRKASISEMWDSIESVNKARSALRIRLGMSIPWRSRPRS